MIKLLIVDDSALMRKHLVSLFEQEGDFSLRTCAGPVWKRCGNWGTSSQM